MLITINSLISGDPKALYQFFFVECRSMLAYIGSNYFGAKYTPEELAGELYEVLSKDEWHKLRIFKGESSLMTYVTVIATRHFMRKAEREHELMDIDDLSPSALPSESFSEDSLYLMKDVHKVLSQMNEIDKFLIQHLLIDGDKPRDIMKEASQLLDRPPGEELAGYLYTRYNRAKKQLKLEMQKLGYR